MHLFMMLLSLPAKRIPFFMATNRPDGDNSREGVVRTRSQVYNLTTGLWTKQENIWM